MLPAQVSPPQFALSELAPHEIGQVECLAFTVAPDGDTVTPGPGMDAAGAAFGLDLRALLDSARAQGTVGAVTVLPVSQGGVRVVLAVGVGEGTDTDLRRAAASLARATKGRHSVAYLLPDGVGAAGVTATVVGAMLGSFEFRWRQAEAGDEPVARIVLCGRDPQAEQAVVDRAVAIGGAAWRARMLATVPSNVKNPGWLASQAVEMAGSAGLDVEVWDEQRLAEEGCGGILGVGRASVSPPRMVKLTYTPVGADTADVPHVVLVGKSITFDSGGLSIKPGDSMLHMKRDMTGGAVVLSAMAALADVGCPVRVTGLLAAAENVISGNALRPGDVLVHPNGRTTEVTNTDAEGRLVMADAMAYAVDQLAPDVLVDVATLTGAMKVALGQHTGGFFANDETLASRIDAAGAASGERVWRMPLWDDYEDKISSKIADSVNSGPGPGAITAALYLQHFAGDVPWAHLDVASVGDAPAERFEWTTGPTGFGARLLLEWLSTDEPLAGIV
ncbi:leucyl aminopeptidase family protein [Nocardioides yefusunii]|nr:leucyl aminopeptidase family protein [Nocardioides yefusunii]